jgi:hypothetical protein
MHKGKINIEAGSKINPKINSFLRTYFEPDLINNLFKNGGEIYVTIKLQKPKSLIKVKSDYIDQKFIDILIKEEKPEIILEKLNMLNKESLFELCKKLQIPISKKTTISAIRDVVYSYIRFPDRWRQISK